MNNAIDENKLEKERGMAVEQETTRYERDMVAKDKCPRCRGPLDTGWECNDCGYDAMPIAHLPPLAETQ